MSNFHQIQFLVLIMAFIIARLQSMITEMTHEFLGDYGEYITGYDHKKMLIETPKNFIKLNLIGYSLFYGSEAFILFFNYLGGL